MQHVKPPRLDIDPTIALTNADDWVRHYKAALRGKPFSHDVMKQARVERSAYQHDLIRRFARFVMSRLRRSRAADVSAPAAQPARQR